MLFQQEYEVIQRNLLELNKEEKISLSTYRYYSRLLLLEKNARMQGIDNMDLRQIGFSLGGEKGEFL
ncbi:hypothetical protein M3936_19775 [Sutcliffiella horikoshii]|uniref:hypothetical protein n=1 Tax=Sutcliffiella horikoshii TaxID=79883 RepID=UPI00203FAA8B|nr:hypothetical protein [Sutcliffiella horikoshii]MCM3619814.1 hypothetical protein [Sutcliffiella horikoshii]